MLKSFKIIVSTKCYIFIYFSKQMLYNKTEMSKIGKTITLCILGGLAVAIFVVCLVFASQNRFGQKYEGENAFALKFNYGTTMSAKLGDTISFAPTLKNNDSFITFSSSDNSMVEIDSNGNVTFKKVGSVKIDVSNHNVKIHSTQVSVSFDYEIKDFENCSYHDEALYVSGENARFTINFLSSTGAAFVPSNNPTFSSSSGLVAGFFFGKICLGNVQPAILTINYAEQNVSIQIAVIVE